MRLNQLFIWITLTALLQWSSAQAQEEAVEEEVHNAPEVSVNASVEQLPMSTTEMPVIEKEREPELDHLTTDMVVEDSTSPPPVLPESTEEKAEEIEAETPETHLPAEQHSLSTVATEKEKATDEEHDSPAQLCHPLIHPPLSGLLPYRPFQK
ncbi:uncharacterized protein Dwil_GK23890 [Drosophila willistoni]|uniref:DUF4794 domain-containing protein n=1 Tax=Drosophila willistoni TaxID=7260 RepID=A0A0Q9WQ83_DROWI|nr:uncharacterized protein Dwil_GK23890 [Drosophila willistoni]